MHRLLKGQKFQSICNGCCGGRNRENAGKAIFQKITDNF